MHQTNEEEEDVETKSQDSNDSVLEGFKVSSRRRYINTQYILPNDQEEISRLDYQHYIVRYLFHGLFVAPVDELLDQGIKVLDVGCGSGKWLLEMAKDYPRSTFLGTDIADVFPKTDIPPNCSFQLGNTVEGLPFKKDTFDYVFQRFMGLAFTPDNWRSAMIELVRVTKPGGWVECIDIDLALERSGETYTRFSKAADTAMRTRGIDQTMTQGYNLKYLFKSLEDVSADYVSLPIGWGGRGGDLSCQNIQMFMTAMKEPVAPYMEITDEIDKMVVSLPEEFKRKRTWGRIPYAFGRKPLQG